MQPIRDAVAVKSSALVIILTTLALLTAAAHVLHLPDQRRQRLPVILYRW